MDGIIFISYARSDTDRVRRLVDYLSGQGLSVWWDEDLAPGVRFRDAIYSVLEKSSCVIVVWTRDSVTRDFVRSEADSALRRGVLVPVLLDADARVPLGFTELHHLDLSRWDGRAGETIDRLVSRLRVLAQRKTYTAGPALVDNDWAVDRSRQATDDLQVLVSGIRSIGEVLISDARAAEDVRSALREVDNTYRAVAQAVRSFVAPVLSAGSLAAEPYLEMERGILNSDIQNGRGHCLRILTVYGRAHGLRDWLKARLQEGNLRELDGVFEKLGTADGDLFAQMTQIGETLTNESRVIVNLLLAGQEAAARQRIIEGRRKLEPLEKSLDRAQTELKKLESSLGYAATR
jgi:hypothetical protein